MYISRAITVFLNSTIVFLVAFIHRQANTLPKSYIGKCVYHLKQYHTALYIYLIISIIICINYYLLKLLSLRCFKYKFNKFECACVLLNLSVGALVWDENNWSFLFLYAFLLSGLFLCILSMRERAGWLNFFPCFSFSAFLYILCYKTSYYSPYAMLTFPCYVLFSVSVLSLVSGLVQFARSKKN